MNILKSLQGKNSGNVEEKKINSKQSVDNKLQKAVTPTTQKENTNKPENVEQDFSYDKFYPKKARFPFVYFIIFTVILVLALMVALGIKYKNKIKPVIGLKGEIEWWGYWMDEDIVDPLIKKYENEHKNIKIKYVKQSPIDYKERLENALLRGEGPDVFSFHNSWTPMFKESLDIVPSNAYSIEEFVNTFYPVIVSDLNTPQGFIGIPLQYDAMALYINEDSFAAAAKTPPTTWDQFKELAKEMTSRDSQKIINQAGASLGLTENVDHWQEIVALMLLQNGVNLANPSDNQAVDALEYYASFSISDRVWDNTLPRSTIAFSKGKSAMYFGPSYRANYIKKENGSLSFRTTIVPQVRRNDPNAPDISYSTYWVEGVWTKSQDKDIAWDFIKYLSSRESLEEIYAIYKNKGEVGYPYPRIDMRELQINDKILGSIVALAPDAKSWYLASDTNDGERGINFLLSGIYSDAVKSAINKGISEISLKKTATEIAKVMSSFGLLGQ